MSVPAFSALASISRPIPFSFHFRSTSSSKPSFSFASSTLPQFLSRFRMNHGETSHTNVSTSPPSSSKSLTLICTTLTAPTVSQQIQQAHQATAAGADLVEIRVDLLDPSQSSNWSQILTASPLPSIVTNRPVWEGGKSQLPEYQRISILLDAIRMRASHIDVELAAFDTFQSLLHANKLTLPLPNTRLILSHHNFQRSLPAHELASIQAKMAPYADIAKIAMTATSALDNLLVISTLHNAKIPTIILAMGDLGQLSRILASKYGAYLTFASIASGEESAPGQLDTNALVSMYRFHEVCPNTPAYGVIGNPVSHSMSPALHNAALTAAGLPGVYLPLKVESNYPEFIRSMASCGFHGFSVTIPGKVSAIDAMDEMDPVAQKIGAMNTVVVRRDGTLKGYNTDWVAAISAVEEQVHGGLRGKRVVCLGAGGAGRALAFGALEKGAKSVIVVNRTLQKAIALALDLGEQASGMSLEEFNKGIVKYDVLMNSTSVGMHPAVNESPVGKQVLIARTVVFDAVYNPLRTRLLREAEELGCKTVSGVEMFVRQAAEQFRLWFPDVEVPIEKMRSVVMQKLSS